MVPDTSTSPDEAATDSALSGEALLRLLRLASPALPVGAYSYSQGLEWAIESGTVHDAASAREWIADLLRFSLARFEAPLWWRLYRAWAAGDTRSAAHWNELYVASRETAELRAESLQMGGSLKQLALELAEYPPDALAQLRGLEPASYVAVAAFCAAVGGIAPRAALLAYLWSWAENQVLAAIKAVPLGQLGGQRMLLALSPEIERAVAVAEVLEDDQLSNFAPGLALASSLHETQYSRLFRS